MKKIKFTCPHCEAKLRVPTHLAGVSAPCPKCGSTITAPSDVTTAVLDAAVPRRPASVPLTSSTPARTRSEPVPAAHQASMIATVGSTAVMEAPTSVPVAELPQAPARIVRERPAPVSEPLPTPAITEIEPVLPAPAQIPQVPVAASPAFFTPPPPVPPALPPEPETESDDRSEPPVSIREDAQIVVEEHYFPEIPPAPPAPITQPIQVTATRGDLPYTRSTHPGGESLPRLDISLAGQDLSAAAALLFAEAPSHGGRTRVILPQPGSDTERIRPEDFFVPAPPPVTAVIQPPNVGLAAPTEEPSFENFEDLAVAEIPASKSRYTTIPLPSGMAPIPLDDLEVGDEEFEEGPETFSPLAEEKAELESEPSLPELPPFELPDWEDDEAESYNLSDSTATHPWPPTETTSVPLQSPIVAPVSRRQLVADEPLAEIPANPLHEGSFGKLFAQQPAPEYTPASPFALKEEVARSESDVLDDLFDSPESDDKSKGLSKTVIIMIASIIGVAIIAGVGMVFVIKALGGLSPAEDYRDAAGDAPAVAATQSVKPKVPTSAATAPTAEPPIADAPAIIDPAALLRENAKETASAADAPALSYDEKVQQAVNGTGTRGTSVIGSPSLDLIDAPATGFSASTPPAPNSGTPPASAPVAAPRSAPGTGAESLPEFPAGVAPLPGSSAANPSKSLPASAAKDANYNPPDSFPAPGPDDTSLGKTRDVIDAFLRAPDAATRVKYAYQGESLRPTIEDYYKKWTYNRFGRYSPQLYQIETDTSLGGPYWVFIVAESDDDDGFPLIVRTEAGNLKVDWEIFAEFSDRHFLRFREGTMPPPETLRLIIERFSDYYGSDRDAFTDLGKYNVYQVNPPYGGELNEFSEFVFVEKDSALAKELDGLVKMGDEPLAVILTLDQKAFAHGVKHFVISDFVTEGWFR